MTEPRCVCCKREISRGRRVIFFVVDRETGAPEVSCDTCTPPTAGDELLKLCRCGREIWGLPDELVGVSLFCSLGCQADDLRAPAEDEPMRECAECQASLRGARATARYCSSKCRQKAWRKRNGEAAATAVSAP